jgi:hypothetical protein
MKKIIIALALCTIAAAAAAAPFVDEVRPARAVELGDRDVAGVAPRHELGRPELVKFTALPDGATIDRSVGPIYLGEADGNDIGCAITYHAATDRWYASDFRCPHGVDPMTYTATFGPHVTKAGARSELDPLCVSYLDTEGTDGSSAWLELP